VRKSFGDPVAEDLRFVVKKVVGEENFIDMYPNRSNNFCCGGGGGFLQSGYPDERRAYGKLKADQILATKAAYAITPCHNCHAQVHDLSEQLDHPWQTVHLWTLSVYPWAFSAPTSANTWVTTSRMWMCSTPSRRIFNTD
jgi:Fe-S oxidoreductase